MYYISIRQGKEISFDHIGPRVFRLPPTFSLLWTLGSNRVQDAFISFSPFLPFKGHPEKNAAGNDGIFFIILMYFLFFKYGKYFPMGGTNKLVDWYCNRHFISAMFQNLFITNESIWIARYINYFFDV